MKNSEQMTDNEYFKALNERFDKRVAKLVELECKYDKDRKEWKVGFLTSSIINNSFVMHADDRVFDLHLRQHNLNAN